MSKVKVNVANIKKKADKVSTPEEKIWVEKISEEKTFVWTKVEDFLDQFAKEKGGTEVTPETVKTPYIKEWDYRITPMGNKVTYTGKMFEWHKVFRVWFKRIDKELLAYKDEKLWFVELEVGDDGVIYRKEKQLYINKK
jgi:hypothetical protein